MLQESVLEQLAQRATQYSVNLNGRVRRDQLCSRGGYGVVWRGTLSPQGVQVAVKTVGSDYVSPEDTETIKAAVREVHTWSKLSHVNVIRLLGITTEFNNTISFVSEWTENGNAHNYVQDVTVDPRPLLDGIASGLAYLHNHKPTAIFHGDLKGANVLISPEGHPLLTDFGLSCVVESSLNISVASCHGGSLRWMAPENLDTGNITAAGDVWAFGMTALELFTRKVPFHDRHGFPAIMCAITRERPERPSEVETLGRMTDDWWDICWSCWNTDPLARPPMTSIVCDISYVFANLHASLSPTIRPRHVQPAPTIPNNVVLPMVNTTVYIGIVYMLTSSRLCPPPL
ncbi:hypothetical protein ID866_7594 [Astraeus odoratus]|nr:hypothetical protein ID866_7594 [Astraeus odoratus]